MKKKFYLLAPALFFTACFTSINPLAGQNQLTDTTGSETFFERGMKFNDEEEYDSALVYYAKISYSDPEYSRACYETALTLSNKHLNPEALLKCDEAIDLHYDVPQLYSLKGSLLDLEGKHAEGASVIASALKKWPYSQNLMFNLAICLINMNELEQAEKVLLQSIRINPYHLGSTRALAAVNLRMGRLGRSYLAYNMALILNPSVSALSEYEKVIFGKSDSLIHAYRYNYKNDADSVKWKNLTMMLQTGFMVADGFNFQFKPDYKLLRTSYLLFNSISYDEADTSLYNQFYLRFFDGLMEKFGFEVFGNYCLKKINNAVVNEWIEKHNAYLSEFVKWAQDRINLWREYGFSATLESSGIKRYHFNDSGNLHAIGTLSAGDVKSGEWINLTTEGGISDRGNFSEGKKTGRWIVYWDDATVKQQLEFNNDSLNGVCYTYHMNGAKCGIYHFRNDTEYGKEEQYTPSGELSSYKTYDADTLDGPFMYIDYDGWYKREFSYKSGKANGRLTETWLNGVKKFDGNLNNGLKNGVQRSWYPNAKQEYEENYVNDTISGVSSYYYRNGQLMKTVQYDNQGRLSGIVKNYRRDGSLESIDSVYIEGLLCGSHYEYYKSGIVKEELEMMKDKPASLKAYDSTGKLIFHTRSENGILHYKSFYPDGRLHIQGDLKDGLRNGEWVTKSPSGIKLRSDTYVDSYLTGPHYAYYPCGETKEHYLSDSSRIIGPYVAYYSDGSVKTSGQYQRSGESGRWITYYPDHSIKSEGFYFDGHPVGCNIYKSIKHKKLSEFFYNNDGKEVRSRIFDETGKLNYDLDYSFGEVQFSESYRGGSIKRQFTIKDNMKQGESRLTYPNGKIWQQIPFCYNNIDGIVRSWDPGGLPEYEISFLMGKRTGPEKSYTDGKLSSVEILEDDNREGPETDYYPDGTIRRQIEWSGDSRNGNSDYYAPDGNLMYRLIFWDNVIAGYSYPGKDGRLLTPVPVDSATSVIRTFYANGKPSMKSEIKSGMLHGRFTCWYPDGKVFMESDYSEGEEEGMYITWSSNGTRSETTAYTRGYSNGQYTLYFPDGKVKLKGSYCFGEEDGPWDRYDAGGKHLCTYKYDGGRMYEIVSY